MKIVLPGGSGQVGTMLARAFVAEGHDVVVLGRTPQPTPGRCVRWDGATFGDWAREIDGADVVVNLAGRSVDCRYSARNRREILDSRVRTTRVVATAIRAAARPPRVWLQASTATIYAHTHGPANDETGALGGTEPDAPASWKFSVDVARAWESAANEADLGPTRVTLLRSALTLSPDRGGVFDVLLRLVRFGLGGAAGPGTQYVSWVHDADFVAAVRWLIEHDLPGPVNVASPSPVTNAEFMRELRGAWGIRVGLPAPGPLLALGAWALRTETELVLKSRRVVPGRLLASGFRFAFPSWAGAARDLCARWRLGTAAAQAATVDRSVAVRARALGAPARR